MTDTVQTAQNDEWEIDNLPNRITLFRVVLIPIIIVSLCLIILDIPWMRSWHHALGYIAGYTFIAASITDFFDGYYARKRNIVTVFGSFLDPIADKFLIVSSLVLLQGLDRIPAFVVLVLILREFYITSLRLLASDQGLSVPVGSLGKWKTATQMVAIPMLMANNEPWGIPYPLMGTILIYTASIFSLYSALQYSIQLVRKIKTARLERKQQALKAKDSQ